MCRVWGRIGVAISPLALSQFMDIAKLRCTLVSHSCLRCCCRVVGLGVSKSLSREEFGDYRASSIRPQPLL